MRPISTVDRTGVDPLIAGVQEFHRHTAQQMRPTLSRLAAEGQSPRELFVTCADSRVVPHAFTSSGPGDLFTLRNIGNLIPPYDCDEDDSVAATIEFAVERLGVPSITVCGHSNCGAMAELLEMPAGGFQQGSALHRWLRHGQKSLMRLNTNYSGVSSPATEDAERLCVINIVTQLENLSSYPAVRRAIEQGNLRLTGMYFAIENAEVWVLDQNLKTFNPV